MNVLVDFYCDNNLGDDIMGEALVDFLIENEHKCFMKIQKDDFISPAFLKKKQICFMQDISRKNIALSQINVYMKIGGSMFPHGTIKEGILRHYELLQMWELKKANVKICIINCNLGPVKSKVGLRATKSIFQIADFITCRDQETYNFIPKRKENKFCYPDIVFNLENSSGQSICKDYIGISVYTGYASYLRYANAQYADFIAQFINLYHQKNEKQKFRLFIFDTGYNSDLPVAYKILENVKNKSKIEIVAYISNKKKFLEKYKECNLMIGTRFHSIVLALKYRIPLYPITYSNKAENLLRYLNYKGKYTKIAECNSVELEKMMNCIENQCLFTLKNEDFLEQSGMHLLQLKLFLNSLIKS